MTKTAKTDGTIVVHQDHAYWRDVEKTDPRHVKPITGRQYSGTSPNVTYLIEKATKVYGLCGHGFGWEVVDERYLDGEVYQNGTREIHHVVRIRFWTRHPMNGEIGHFESYGQTRMAYMTKGGRYQFDEDGPKKSLTDAITKALSQLGFSADIFMGRYDDNKYVAELRGEFGASADTPTTPAAPPPARNGAAPTDNPF